MRCSRCRRRGSIRPAARSPEGKLVFNWCQRCHTEVSLRALGIETASRLPREKPSRIVLVPPRLARLVDLRRRAMVVIAFVFAMWGLLVCAAGLAQGIASNRIDVGTSPVGLLRSRVFTTGGAVIIVLAVVVALGTVPPGDRRLLLLRLVRGGCWAGAACLSLVAALGLWPGGLRQVVGITSAAVALGWSAHLVEGCMRADADESKEWRAVIDLMQPRIKKSS